MSDEQDGNTNGDSITDRDRPEPPPERQAELRAMYEANIAGGKAPYEGIHVGSVGEITWILQEHHWTGEMASGLDEHANLRG